jgi:indole-3-glycerol phosphate synthase
VNAPRQQTDLLAAIVAGTRRIVELREQREPLRALSARADAMPPAGGRFLAALSDGGRVNVVAECKRRSPSRGVLCRDYDPAAIARCYEAAGAAAISVLTEPTFFDGTLQHLAAVRAAVQVPLLRKDFIVSEYQLLEARAAGADAVLLIVAALRDDELKALAAGAIGLGLDTLVEVHDERELERAFAIGARIVGVNNRNLRTLQVDVSASERLIAQIPAEVVAVSESGLRSPDDLMRLKTAGYRAFLIGERLMATPDPGAALRDLLGRPANRPAARPAGLR